VILGLVLVITSSETLTIYPGVGVFLLE
jgi:hypothetical protein